MIYIFTLFSAVHLNLTCANCPFTLRIYPNDNIILTIEGKYAYSFANWQDNVYIQMTQGSSSYGPYNNKKNVFGVYFTNDTDLIITNESNQHKKLVIGCQAYYYKDDNDFQRPNNYQPVGPYNYDYKLTNYPILFTDDQGISYFYIGVGIVIVGCFVASFIIFFRKTSLRSFICSFIPARILRLFFGNSFTNE